MQELYEIRSNLIEKLNTLIKNKRDYGKLLAEAERIYRKELTSTMATMLLEGFEFNGKKSKPLAATAVYNMDRGIAKVADLRAKRDGYDVLADTIQESIYSTKLQISIIEDDIKNVRRGL